jgi:hypothetical protein
MSDVFVTSLGFFKHHTPNLCSQFPECLAAALERHLSVVDLRISWNGERIKPLKRFRLIL